MTWCHGRSSKTWQRRNRVSQRSRLKIALEIDRNTCSNQSRCPAAGTCAAAGKVLLNQPALGLEQYATVGSSEVCLQAFQAFDQSGSGQVDMKELRHIAWAY